ncbi:PEGA domain-containing protein [candidate division WOR-3 bacterium]|nr:PEGA domain-containing protein [candidate division WOR-3 bacterium]
MAVALALALLSVPPDSGYLTVRSDRAGIPLYFDGDYLGTTPLDRRPVKAGEFSLVPCSSDSLENLYWRLRNAGLGAKLSALWALARIDAGTARVNVRPGTAATVALSGRDIDNAACRARWLVYGGTGAVFLTGVLAGVVIYALVS